MPSLFQALTVLLVAALVAALLLVQRMVRRQAVKDAAAREAAAYERAWAAVLPDLTVTLNGKPATAATLAALKHLNSPAERKD